MDRNEFQKEVVKSINPNKNGLLLLAPRAGKTKIMIDYIKKWKPKSILWVTPSKKLKDKDIVEEFKKWDAESFIENLETITWNVLGKKRGNYNLIILDEIQAITENNSKTLVTKELEAIQIIAMTGTLSRHKLKNSLIHKIGVRDVFFNLSIKDAVDIGLLSDYEVIIVPIELDKSKNITVRYNKGSFKTSEYKQYKYYEDIALNASEKKSFRANLKKRNIIVNSPSKLKRAKKLIRELKGKKIIFSGNTDIANKLCKYRYHSKVNSYDLDKFLEGKIDCLSMVNAGGTGFTFENVEHLILVQVDSDANRLTTQKVARVLLKQKHKPKIWILMLKGTADEKWVGNLLKILHKDKIKYYGDNKTMD